MKRRIITALLATIFVLMPATAQEREARENAAEAIAERVATMAKQADLTDEQAAQVKKLLADFKESGDAAALRRAFGALLTPEQRQALAQRPAQGPPGQARRRARTAARNAQRGAWRGAEARERARTASAMRDWQTIALGLRMRMLASALDLTEGQHAQLRSIHAEQMKADSTQASALHDAISSMLTPEQRTRFEALRTRMEAGQERLRMQAGRLRGRMQGRTQVRRRAGALQRRPGRAYRMERRFDRRGNRQDGPQVRLNPEQEEKMEAVRRQVAEEHRAFTQENPNASDEEKRAFGLAQRKKMAEAMASTLTAEQELLRMRAEERNRRPASFLNLSEEQEDKVKEALATYRQAMAAWMEANPDASPDARMEHNRMQRDALQTALKDILTEEQLEKLDRTDTRRDRPRRNRRRR